ncbi:MAG: substrate-binding domain-containing protein [bacterium]
MKSNVINKKISVPLKEQLRQWILGRISTGDLKTGDRIPSINKLAESFNIGRETIRLSLETLVQRGILIPHQGKGYFIAPREKRVLRVGLLGKIDGVYIRPVYEGLTEELGGDVSILVMDNKSINRSISELIENLAYHQSVDRLLIVPVRGNEEELNKQLEPFRRYFKIAWLDRSPKATKDAKFLCDYKECVETGLDHFNDCRIQSRYYFSRNSEDNSVFSLMRQTYRNYEEREGKRPAILTSLDDVLRIVRNQKNDYPDKPVGILAETDEEGVYIHSRLMKYNVEIPQMVSLISCDNTGLTDLVSPNISSVDPGFKELGRQAALWIKRDHFNLSVKSQNTFIAKPVLIKKETTG